MKVKYYPVTDIISIQEMLLKTVSQHTSSLALADLVNTPINRVTYSELLDKVLKFGNALNRLGLKEGCHIAIVGDNRVQWGMAYLTAMCFNMIVVPIDKNLTSNEIINILYESESEAIVFSESLENMLRNTYVLKKLKYYISMDLLAKKGGYFSMKELIDNTVPLAVELLPRVNPDEMAEIIYTSGSVGRAKGVILSQRNLASNLMSMRKMVLIDNNDIFLSVLPIHHTYECTCGLLCPLYSGSAIYYARSLKTVADDLQKVRATILLGVPLLFDKMFRRIYKTINEDKIKSKLIRPLIRISDVVEMVGWKSFRHKVFHELHEKFGGSIKLFIAGGAAPDPLVAKGLREFGFTFLQGYGLTETSPILALNQRENYRDDAAGIPLDCAEIKIENKDTEGVGEIFAKGQNVMIGYYKNPKLTEDSFVDGWFKTGDLGRFDEEGFLHICGRKKNVIIANNGKNVFPEEIEDIINRSPFVNECFVYGEKDQKHDEIIAVQIVIDAEAFIEYCAKNNETITDELIKKIISQVVKDVNKQLTGYKQIKKYYIREREFEKTTTQKIKRYLIANGGVNVKE
ncbi:MAG: AMP-binding protein [Ignavibacteriaceae bacterium]|nr:AMP-binding protein [Ignavibacteriaceae bacterium]